LIAFGDLQKSFLKHIRRIDASLEGWVQSKPYDLFEPRTYRLKEHGEFLDVSNLKSIISHRLVGAGQSGLAALGIRMNRG
jgi:hypothetical protein